MMLTEETAVPLAALPMDELKAHLRLGAGFALAPDQDGLLESHLRAAMAAIEGRTAKVLIERRFRWELDDWRDAGEQALPVAPVGALISVTLRDAAGDEVTVAPEAYRLIADLHRPRIAGRGVALPSVPVEGAVALVFDAGFGPGWADVPADLRQAVLLLAAEFYEHRHDDGAAAPGLPFGVVALIERWRQVRILGGGGRR
ncbi:head-tail connector protein [Xinfangfangia pollutisoli]|uniref:head-tail connector protein n=1 Tax=Xinfangfangia pollutisoli TaxID=2865960 RepID=UPI001CD461A1|nr:head-tail connector protein [Xinfangfangia pollutisoli]